MHYDSGYHANGECRFRKGDLRAEIDPLGRRTEYLKYDAFGRVVQARGIDGVVVEQLFDHTGRPRGQGFRLLICRRRAP
ncbi:RHS repeat domain-containing protein [Stenotrophomonas sp. SrG]|uniref:RHS repeat domain-containing protein n=1 Tax=Stenotrophomonas sp. SrG TaxID=3414430 RepID=UPI003CE6F91A